jgi:outer membrane protein
MIANKTLRSIVCLISILACSITAQAQTALRLASLSHNAVMQRMTQYHEAQKNLKALRSQYEAEAKRSEEDFQRKFVEFMDGQKDFPETILLKRQNELQNMLESNAKFRIKVQDLLAKAEKDLMNDVKAVLLEAVHAVAAEEGYGLVFNTDGDAISFIADGIATDITDKVLRKLDIVPVD